MDAFVLPLTFRFFIEAKSFALNPQNHGKSLRSILGKIGNVMYCINW